MTTDDLDRLDAIAAAATPGPWYCTRKTAYGEPIDAGDVSGPKPAAAGWGGKSGRYVFADADFIAAFDPVTVRALIAEVRRLRSAYEPATKPCPRCESEDTSPYETGGYVCFNCQKDFK